MKPSPRFNLVTILTLLTPLIVLIFATQQVFHQTIGAPLDDAYIHFTFARNLRTLGEWSFNPGSPSLGASSPLWIILLALVSTIIRSEIISAYLLNAVFFLSTIFIFYHLFTNATTQKHNQTLITLLSTNGLMVFWIFSGMEVLLFLTLFSLLLLMLHKGKWTFTGIILSLLILTRIEGIILIPLLLFTYRKNIRPVLLKIFVPPLLILFSYLLFNQLIGGQLLPFTSAGRKLLWFGPTYTWVDVANASIYFIPNWLDFIINRLYLYPIQFHQPILLILELFLVIMFIFSVHKIFQKNIPSLKVLALAFLGWNGLYLLLMPVPGQAARYQPLNTIFLMLTIFLSTQLINRKTIRNIVSGCLIAISIYSLLLWTEVTQVSIDQIQKEHVTISEEVLHLVPLPPTIAAFDIGVLGYLANGATTVIDVGCLIESSCTEQVRSSQGVEYIINSGTSTLIMPEFFFPDDNAYHFIYYNLKDEFIAKGYQLKLISRIEYPNTLGTYLGMTVAPTLSHYQIIKIPKNL